MLHRLAVLALLLVTSACSTVASSTMVDLAPRINATYRPAVVRVKPGDVLTVTFSERPEWNHTATVQPDGNAAFLQLDQVHVQGKAVAEIDALLTERYGREVRAYDLTVALAPRAPSEVQIIGALNGEGPVAFEGEHLDLLEALARAGGPKSGVANLGNVLLLRRTSPFAAPQAWRIDLRMKHWSWSDPIQLMPGDLIYIPERRIVGIDRWVDQFIRRLIPMPQIFTVA